MKLENVQSTAAALIEANATLAAFGAPIQFSPFLEENALKTDISERLRTHGVCIEIGGVEATRTSETATARGVTADATFDVYIAESAKVAHTPSGNLLRKALIDTLTVQAPYGQRIEFAHSDTAITEHGYILHILGFTVRVTIP